MDVNGSWGNKEDCRPWYDQAFDRHYLDLYGHRDETAAQGEVEFAVQTLGLKQGDRVLDLSCGPGHHLERLKEHGMKPLGLDLSRALLECAAKNSAAVRGDMRRLPLRGPFAGVLTFFTTLGYFSEADNRQVLEEMSRILAAGGAFLIDHINASKVRRTLVPQSTRKVRGFEIVESRRIEEDPARVLKTVRFVREGREARCYTESVRLYGEEELKEELARAGLSVRRTHGDFDSSPFHPDSRRMILTGEKERTGRKM
jgi:ubiquinone/menaquinone biosynthesis C-methylase UbiE